MSLYPVTSKGEGDAQRAQMLLDAIILRRELRKSGTNFSDIQQRPTLLILCGLPGTGKTYTVRAVVKRWEAEGKTVLMACPTARAARIRCT